MRADAPNIARAVMFGAICAGSALVTWIAIGRRQRELDENTGSRSSQSTFLILAALALGIAIQDREGLFTPRAVAFLGAACALTIAGVCMRDRMARWPIANLAIACTVVVFMGMMALVPPAGWMSLGFEARSPFAILLAVTSVIAGIAIGLRRVPILPIVITIVGLYAAMGAWVIYHSPFPGIDVFLFQRDSAAALLARQNPYALTFPNMYGNWAWVYADEVQSNGRLLFGYPYMPLTLWLTTPSHALLGDVRYAHLAANTIAAALIAMARPNRMSLLAATCFLFSPRAFYILEQGWIESFVVLMLAATVFAAIRFPRAMPYVLGLFLVSKQYVPGAVLLTPLLVPREKQRDARTWIQLASRAALSAAIVTLPLVLWNFGAFWKSVVWLQVKQPFRHDALSFLAALADVRYKYGQPPIVTPPPFAQYIAFLALVLGAALSLWKLKPSPRSFAIGVSLTFLLFFAFNKQAFANYYFFVIGALFTAIAIDSSSERGTSDN